MNLSWISWADPDQRHLPLDKMAAISLVQVMAWRRIGDKPLSELMLTQLTDTYKQHSEQIELLPNLIPHFIIDVSKWVDGMPTSEVTPVTIW